MICCRCSHRLWCSAPLQSSSGEVWADVPLPYFVIVWVYELMDGSVLKAHLFEYFHGLSWFTRICCMRRCPFSVELNGVFGPRLYLYSFLHGIHFRTRLRFQVHHYLRVVSYTYNSSYTTQKYSSSRWHHAAFYEAGSSYGAISLPYDWKSYSDLSRGLNLRRHFQDRVLPTEKVWNHGILIEKKEFWERLQAT